MRRHPPPRVRPAGGWRPRRGRGGLAFALAAACAAGWPGGPASAAAPPARGTIRAARPLGPLELAGKRIYLEGTSPSGGNVTARVGEEVLLPGSAVPCASCHGEDGRGRPEGGATPPSLRWSDLVHPGGHAHEDGRRHPPFDARSLARAITGGVDPAGNPLDRAMPRYALARRDLDALLAYLRVLERDLDPGLAPARIRIGTVLPDRGPGAGAGVAMANVLRAAFDEANARGGVNGRRLDLVVEGFGPGPGAAAAAARRLLARDVFALVAGFMPGEDEAVAALAEGAGVPLVGPLSPSGRAGREHVFLVSAGIADQARALAAACPPPAPAARAWVVHASGLAEEAQVGAAALRARGFAAVEVLVAGEPGAGTATLRARAPEAVLVLAGDAALAPLVAGVAAGPSPGPRLLVPALLAARAASAAPEPLRDRILVAFPALPGDVRAGGARALAAAGVDPAGAHVLEAIAARAAAVLLEEGLARAGRGLGRRRLVEALEAIRGLETGVTRPLSFGPGRRVGTAGAHVLTLRAALEGAAAADTWVEVGPR